MSTPRVPPCPQAALSDSLLAGVARVPGAMGAPGAAAAVSYGNGDDGAGAAAASGNHTWGPCGGGGILVLRANPTDAGELAEKIRLVPGGRVRAGGGGLAGGAH